MIKTLNAAMSGIPVDMSKIAEIENPIGLIKMWKDTK
jgi:hypothetical protein